MNDYRLPIGTAKKLEMLGTALGLEAVVSFLEALEQFAEDGTTPDDVHPFVAVLLADVLPINDKARKKAEAGKLGGSKTEAKAKQTASKSEANGKQTVSKPEANAKQEREEERDDEREEKEIPPTPPKEREQKEAEKVEEKEVAPSFDISCDISHYGACAEQTKSDSAPPEPPILTFPLAKGKTFAVTQSIFDMLAECYPNVDTMEELRKVKSWSEFNPKRRKVDGLRFLNNWFSKQQDRGGFTDRPRRPTPEETYSLPAINPWALPGEVTG